MDELKKIFGFWFLVMLITGIIIGRYGMSLYRNHI